MVVVDPSLLSADSLARALVILAVGLLLLFSSVITLCVLLNNSSFQDVISVYLASLALGDLLCAVLIVPLSIYSSLAPNWNFMGDNSLLCKSTSYLQVVLISSTIYTFAWVGVDRYSAFMKPARYEIEHTLTRCKCWIAFSWITAILLACPMIVAKMEVNYHHDFELCILNWSTTIAYSITLAVLVLLPTTCTIAFTCTSIFTAMNRPEELEDSQRTIVETDENFVVTLFVLISFILAWLPIIVVQFMPAYLIYSADSSTMKFAFMWLAIGGSSTKLLIYAFTNREFRRCLCSFCLKKLGNNDTDAINPSVALEAKSLWNRNALRVNPNENDAFIPSSNNSGSHYNYNNINYANNQLQFSIDDRQQSSSIIPKSTNSPIVPANMVGHVPEYGSFARSPITYY